MNLRPPGYEPDELPTALPRVGLLFISNWYDSISCDGSQALIFNFAKNVSRLQSWRTTGRILNKTAFSVIVCVDKSYDCIVKSKQGRVRSNGISSQTILRVT